MSFSESDPSKPRKLLIITSSGGGGLLQAAVAKEQEALAADPFLKIVKQDVLKDWMVRGFGKFCIGFWNSAQRRGNVSKQVFGMRSQWIFDYFSWPMVFFQCFRILQRENIDWVIDTQNMGTSAILKALRLYNWNKGKKIVLEKVIVDLPTKEATHYFRLIKKLSKKDKGTLKLKTIRPLLDEGQSAEEFWQENCGLSDRDIGYEDFNVRQSFRKLKGKPRSSQKDSVAIRYKSDEELSLTLKCFERGAIRSEIGSGEIRFFLTPEERLFTVLLGSQPSEESTLNYVKQFVKVVKEDRASKLPIHLFVFCSEHSEKEETLFRKVADFIASEKDLPKHLSVIPFSFQSDEVIAPLFHRSDLTCTRSGGQTAMELMSVSTGEMWIHSEAKKEGPMTLEELLAGIPGWEAASALYLTKIRGAKIVTPEIMAPMARQLLQSNSGQSSPMRGLESTA